MVIAILFYGKRFWIKSSEELEGKAKKGEIRLKKK